MCDRPKTMAMMLGILAMACTNAQAAAVILTGGALGTELVKVGDLLGPSTPIDIDGDGLDDVNFNTFDPPGGGDGFVDAHAPFGITGNIGGGPGTGAAWVRHDSTLAAGDLVGRNEMVAAFRGAALGSDDNWSKVHFSTGDGWVQWNFISSNQIVPLLFVREDADEDLTAAQAFSLAYPVPEPATILMSAVGMLAALTFHRRRSGPPAA